MTATVAAMEEESNWVEAGHRYMQLGKGCPIKAWINGVSLEEVAKQQLYDVALMPFIFKHVAVMPDVHWGMGATIGSVIPTTGAIIPAAVGVDIGCGMMYIRTSLTANDLPDNLKGVRTAIEAAIPHGRTKDGGKGDRGAWGNPPSHVVNRWEAAALRPAFSEIVEKHPKIARSNNIVHLGTLGTGNHFVEVTLDEEDRVGVMLHSGSRGVGNRIGMHFIRKAKEEHVRLNSTLPSKDLAYLSEDSPHFDDYVEAVGWAQNFAKVNREIMMDAALEALRMNTPPFVVGANDLVVNCHHNYVAKEKHFGEDVWVTRKGAVRAREGDLGIIPGSMGAKSFIVRGKGNADSFHSCSHGAGRTMSRTNARKTITLEQHVAATEGVECKKDESVIDESPAAYKSIDAVMAAQTELVDIVHTLKQVVCVKG